MYVVITNHLLTWATCRSMGYFYSTSVSIGWYFSLENGPFTYGKLCVGGRFTPQIWGFSFDPQRATRTQFVVSKDSSVRGGQRINNGVPGLDSVLQSRPLGDF